MKPTPSANEAIYRAFVEKLGASPISEFVGEFGELFYDPADQSISSIRISDGKTPGGVELSRVLTDRVSEIEENIDGSKLTEIRETIEDFVEAGMEGLATKTYVDDTIDAKFDFSNYGELS